MFEGFLNNFPFEPIPNCPGRFVLKSRGVSFEELFAGANAPPSFFSFLRRSVHVARDVVVWSEFDDGQGGLISYVRPDGSIVHTVGNESGFERKMRALGLWEQKLSFRRVHLTSDSDSVLLVVATEKDLAVHRKDGVLNWKQIDAQRCFLMSAEVCLNEAQDVIVPLLLKEATKQKRCVLRRMMPKRPMFDLGCTSFWMQKAGGYWRLSSFSFTSTECKYAVAMTLLDEESEEEKQQPDSDEQQPQKLHIVKLFNGRHYVYLGRFAISNVGQTIGDSGIFRFAPAAIASSCLLYEEVGPLRLVLLDRLRTWEEEGFSSDNESGCTFVIWQSPGSVSVGGPLPEMFVDAKSIPDFSVKIVQHFWAIRRANEERALLLNVILARSAEERGPYFSVLSPELFVMIAHHLSANIEWESPLLFNLYASLRRYLAMFCELEFPLPACCLWLLRQMLLRRTLESCSPADLLDAFVAETTTASSSSFRMPHDVSFRVLMAKTKWESHALWMSAKISGDEETQTKIKKKMRHLTSNV